jgi:hypothetical protein
MNLVKLDSIINEKTNDRQLREKNGTQIKDDENGFALIKRFLPQSTQSAQRRSATADVLLGESLTKSADY